MSFKYTENILSDHVIEHITEKYTTISPWDENSHHIWHPKMTGNNTMPSTWSTQLGGSDKALLRADLYSNPSSPFYLLKAVKHCDVAVLKYPRGSSCPMHVDTAIGALTIFLNKHWLEEGGGHFQYYDGDKLHSVPPKYNCGVYTLYNEQQVGPEHGVSEVLGNSVRCVLQIFMRTPGEVNVKFNERTSYDATPH